MPWFPDGSDPELERLAALVFDLRRRIFLLTEHRRAQERVWETEMEGRRRGRSNEAALMRWDNETRQMILGEGKP